MAVVGLAVLELHEHGVVLGRAEQRQRQHGGAEGGLALQGAIVTARSQSQIPVTDPNSQPHFLINHIPHPDRLYIYI